MHLIETHIWQATAFFPCASPPSSHAPENATCAGSLPCRDGRKRWLHWVNMLVQQHQARKERDSGVLQRRCERARAPPAAQPNLWSPHSIPTVPSTQICTSKSPQIYKVIRVRLSGKCLAHKGQNCRLFFLLYINFHYPPRGFQPTRWSSTSAHGEEYHTFVYPYPLIHFFL